MLRYRQLLDIIDEVKPRRILEVGTWNGNRAVELINRASLYNKGVEYRGYDLFEHADEHTDANELNVKPHCRAADVLEHIRNDTGCDNVELIVGNTNDTLSDVTDFDFVYIDGGHSVETIVHDLSCLMNNKTVILDDYYLPENGKPDIFRFGCNYPLGLLSLKYTLLPQVDNISGGGKVCMVRLV